MQKFTSVFQNYQRILEIPLGHISIESSVTQTLAIFTLYVCFPNSDSASNQNNIEKYLLLCYYLGEGGKCYCLYQNIFIIDNSVLSYQKFLKAFILWVYKNRFSSGLTLYGHSVNLSEHKGEPTIILEEVHLITRVICLNYFK